MNPTSKSCARRYQSPSNHPSAVRVRAAIGTGRRVREASDLRFLGFWTQKMYDIGNFGCMSSVSKNIKSFNVEKNVIVFYVSCFSARDNNRKDS